MRKEENLKIIVSVVNGCAHLEESAREFRRVKVPSRLIAEPGMFTPTKRIDPVNYISERITGAVKLLKEANHAIEQVFVKKKGRDKVTDMEYRLIDAVNGLYYLSTEDQQEVFELIKSKSGK